ncbi:transposase family protein [Leucobacter coleopterorum]|uniref:Transposase family protein n=2 Tax=Leucobacter coleopterorum TaxID=2714933 RepID=A0ABX6JZQ1_9MICO|nr:transposase family protein [Leucobacter coleopterorum]
MRARHEITRKFAKQYQAAAKKDKGTLLDEVCAITGWSRDNARRQLKSGLKPRRVGVRKRKPRPLRYSYDPLKVLQKVWAFAGGVSGKYLAATMELQLMLLEAHGELVPGKGRYSHQVADELLMMSPATIDRYLAPARAKDPLRGITSTTPGPLLRNSITVRKAGDEVEAVPGFFEGDTVAHCGPVLKGEFCRTVDLTDMHIGWTYTCSIRNNAHLHIRDALNRFISEIPYEVTGVDFDNGSEFINYDIIGWAAELDIYFTRSRPHKKNDQATIESKNNQIVRRYGFYWRYDALPQLKLLNELWQHVNDRHNYLTATKKPVGWTTDTKGRRKRVYDDLQTPFDRLLTSGILTPKKTAELIAYRNRLNPARIARDIDRIQQRLTYLAAHKTRTLEAAELAKAPDPSQGVKPVKTAPKKRAS